MSLQFTGKVTFISPVIEVGKVEKKTQKRVVCLEEQGDMQYPNRLAIDFLSKSIDLVSKMKEGDVVTVFYNALYNRFGEGTSVSIFNSLRGRKVEVIETSVGTASAEPIDDDLPF